MPDVLVVEQSGAVATVTLNRPDSMNALSLDLKEALVDATARLSADDSVRAVVLTGAGRAFCVGQDLHEHHALLGENDPSMWQTVTRHYNPITYAIASMPKPVIAAVNGMAAGAGAGFALAADFRIASQSASFLMAFANVGLSLDSGTSWTLERIVGHARATALALLAEPVHADAALDMGLVNAVVEADHVLPAAQELAQRLAQGPTVAYAAIKQSLAFAASSPLTEALDLEAQLQSRAGETEDHRVAVASFLAKQRPTFTGH